MTEDETLALVLQNGEQNIKFGYAGDEEPRSVFNNYAVKDTMGEYTFGEPPARPGY
jgi:actin-related protein